MSFSQNVDPLSVEQFGLILLPTCHHSLQLLLRIVVQESVIKPRTIVLGLHHLLNRIDESNALHCSASKGEKKLVDFDHFLVVINLQHFVVWVILPLRELQTTKQVIFHLSLYLALDLNSSHWW